MLEEPGPICSPTVLLSLTDLILRTCKQSVRFVPGADAVPEFASVALTCSFGSWFLSLSPQGSDSLLLPNNESIKPPDAVGSRVSELLALRCELSDTSGP